LPGPVCVTSPRMVHWRVPSMPCVVQGSPCTGGLAGEDGDSLSLASFLTRGSPSLISFLFDVQQVELPGVSVAC
jgi:hypothetical protein